MAENEKDRLGDKLRDAERGGEDAYFAKRDRELVAKLRLAKEGGAEALLKDAAHGRCPKCGERLHRIDLDGCPSCRGR